MKKRIIVISLLALIILTGCGQTAVVDSDITWVAPGKVYVDNFDKGETASYTVKVHNGSDRTKYFSIIYKYPDNVGDGYAMPLPQTADWVTIDGFPDIRTIAIKPGEIGEVAVTLSMPENAHTPPDKWEFWINVLEEQQEGMIHIAYGVRWLVTMRGS